MLDNLIYVEENLKELFESADLKSMYIDYHDPYVARIWFQNGENRVFIHKIYEVRITNNSLGALFHPHPRESGVRIIKGTYEMGVGHSDSNNVPKVDARLILPKGTCYEMVEPNGWHYVSPINGPVFSIMVTGKAFDREMPITPNEPFRELRLSEIQEILDVVNEYYNLDLTI